MKKKTLVFLPAILMVLCFQIVQKYPPVTMPSFHLRFPDRINWGVSYWEESALENRVKDEMIYNKVNIQLLLEATY